MQSMILFLTCTLIWGGNYLATKFQYGIVPPEYSVLLRLLIAMSLFLILAFVWRQKKKKLDFRDHIRLFLFGLFSFSINYILFYNAVEYLLSSFIVVIFSVKSVITPILLSIVKRRTLKLNLIAGAFISITGVIFLLKESLLHAHLSLYGIFIAAIATLITSIGEIFSMENSEKEIQPIQANTWALFYSSIVLSIFCFFFIPQKINIILKADTHYFISLIYLSILSSFLAWLCYLILIKRIGAANSSYMVTLFPAIGIFLSFLFEDLHITPTIILGLCIQILGSFIAFYRQIIHSWQKILKKRESISNVE